MKMYRLIVGSAVLGSAVLLVGCATTRTTVIPKNNGIYQVVGTARNSADSQQGAIKKATEVCQKASKRLTVVANKTKYQGAGKEMGAITSVVSSAAFMNGNVNLPSAKSDTDYKTVVTFRCS